MELAAEVKKTVCPHDCPSTCALNVQFGDRIKITGDPDNTYTRGIICRKVAEYEKRLRSPERVLFPMRRIGPKGRGEFEIISWNAAIEAVAERFQLIERQHGSEAIWFNCYAGTMGLLMRDGIERLRGVKGYSGQFYSICSNISTTGYVAGTGKLRGSDPREMLDSDCIIFWGLNAVSTQVNAFSLASQARKKRGTVIIGVDVYENATLDACDYKFVLKPGTDAALACAAMHIMFRDGKADYAYMERYTRGHEALERHLASRDALWASKITGLTVAEIELFADLVSRSKATYFRLGYGFTRQRNGAVSMHSALSVPCVLGNWLVPGGGALHCNGGIYHFDMSLIEGTDVPLKTVRNLDQSQIGRVLTGDREALKGDGNIYGLLVQNTNPLVVSPEQELVRQGFAREDLFTVVHEQVLTETAMFADILLPATMFVEHDDIYRGGGHQHVFLGPKIMEPPGEARSNHDFLCALAKALGAEHPAFEMTAEQILDWTLQKSGYGTLENLRARNSIDVQPPFEEAHFLSGFAWPDGRFRFDPDWESVPCYNDGLMGMWQSMPRLPDYWDVNERTTPKFPFKLVSPPARSLLNSSFREAANAKTPAMEPLLMLSPEDGSRLGVESGDLVSISNNRGRVVIRAEISDRSRSGTLIVEGLYRNSDHPIAAGINTLTSADQVAPHGGVACHDVAVALQKYLS